MDVKLGLGLSTGMFYYAPAGTSLPSTAATTPGSAWTKVGDVSDAGITLALNKTVTNLRNLEAKGKERDLAAQSRRMQAGREAARKAGHAASGGQTGHTGRQA